MLLACISPTLPLIFPFFILDFLMRFLSASCKKVCTKPTDLLHQVSDTSWRNTSFIRKLLLHCWEILNPILSRRFDLIMKFKHWMRPSYVTAFKTLRWNEAAVRPDPVSVRGSEKIWVLFWCCWVRQWCQFLHHSFWDLNIFMLALYMYQTSRLHI